MGNYLNKCIYKMVDNINDIPINKRTDAVYEMVLGNAIVNIID